MNRKALYTVLALALLAMLTVSLRAQRSSDIPPALLSLDDLEDIILEVSGDLALQNEVFLTGVNRNRKPEEYVRGYFETRFILERLKEYGIKDAAVVELPSEDKDTWDAESAELVMVEPYRKKLADLKEIVRREVVSELDHRDVNEILENPTAAALAVWAWNRLADALPGLAEIEIHETSRCSVAYRGE